MSNLADSDGLQKNDFGYAGGEGVVGDASVYGFINVGAVTVMAEYLSAFNVDLFFKYSLINVFYIKLILNSYVKYFLSRHISGSVLDNHFSLATLG
ncbi:MAG: hypothetical protein ACJAUP_001815 [Cellvibrionaceae bacterium]